MHCVTIFAGHGRKLPGGHDAAMFGIYQWRHGATSNETIRKHIVENLEPTLPLLHCDRNATDMLDAIEAVIALELKCNKPYIQSEGRVFSIK